MAKDKNTSIFTVVAFSLGIGVGIAICNLAGINKKLPSDSKAHSLPPLPSSVLPSGGVPGRLEDVLPLEFVQLLSSAKLSESQLAAFRLEIEDGRADSDRIGLFLEILAAKWPDSVMNFINCINPKVSHALRLKSMALAKLARNNPDIAIRIISESSENDFEGRELYDIGLKILNKGPLSAAQVNKLGPGMTDAIMQAESESILRAKGVDGLVSWIGSLKSSTLKAYDANGNIISEKSGPTSFALDRLSQFLKETSSVNSDQLFARLASPAFLDNDIELSGAFRVLAEIDAPKALELSKSLDDAHSFAAERGAFMVASKLDPEIALQHLKNTTNIEKQNLMLTLLEANTNEPQIRAECQALLADRGLPISQSK